MWPHIKQIQRFCREGGKIFIRDVKLHDLVYEIYDTGVYERPDMGGDLEMFLQEF